MAARYQHLPAFLSDAVKLLDSAYAEPREELDSAGKEVSSSAIVTVALPTVNYEDRELELSA